MALRRVLTRTTLILLGLLWGGLLTALGIELFLGADPTIPIRLPYALRLPLGAAALTAGQLVFMTLVADRVFPGVNKGPVGVIELTTSAALGVSMLWLALAIVTPILTGAQA